ncbi:hypothetical protein BURPS1710b_A2399 [Burkholderia pseudomallei 1710b]|uniref:Uncharacterized protein n=1 Tax=Burkholderia pseudomallei (strain 1710b) TaxID=320372 RepID=Q3JFV5_BURP1|nr:hypothetical protein BURPS1710b_A2399 [Burkholderia pseudomallei 1710b]
MIIGDSSSPVDFRRYIETAFNRSSDHVRIVQQGRRRCVCQKQAQADEKRGEPPGAGAAGRSRRVGVQAAAPSVSLSRRRVRDAGPARARVAARAEQNRAASVPAPPAGGPARAVLAEPGARALCRLGRTRGGPPPGGPRRHPAVTGRLCGVRAEFLGRGGRRRAVRLPSPVHAGIGLARLRARRLAVCEPARALRGHAPIDGNRPDRAARLELARRPRLCDARARASISRGHRERHAGRRPHRIDLPVEVAGQRPRQGHPDPPEFRLRRRDGERRSLRRHSPQRRDVFERTGSRAADEQGMACAAVRRALSSAPRRRRDRGDPEPCAAHVSPRRGHVRRGAGSQGRMGVQAERVLRRRRRADRQGSSGRRAGRSAAPTGHRQLDLPGVPRGADDSPPFRRHLRRRRAQARAGNVSAPRRRERHGAALEPLFERGECGQRGRRSLGGRRHRSGKSGATRRDGRLRSGHARRPAHAPRGDALPRISKHSWRIGFQAKQPGETHGNGRTAFPLQRGRHGGLRRAAQGSGNRDASRLCGFRRARARAHRRAAGPAARRARDCRRRRRHARHLCPAHHGGPRRRAAAARQSAALRDDTEPAGRRPANPFFRRHVRHARRVFHPAMPDQPDAEGFIHRHASRRREQSGLRILRRHPARPRVRRRRIRRPSARPAAERVRAGLRHGHRHELRASARSQNGARERAHVARLFLLAAQRRQPARGVSARPARRDRAGRCDRSE